MFSFEYQRGRQKIDKEREIESKKLDYRENLLKATLAQAMEGYNTVKKAQRLLRAQAIIQPKSEKSKCYKLCMMNI